MGALKDGLHYFFHQMESASPRSFIKSIAAIVWRQPVFFLQKILEFIRDFNQYKLFQEVKIHNESRVRKIVVIRFLCVGSFEHSLVGH
jgi:hypothetical protein